MKYRDINLPPILYNYSKAIKEHAYIYTIILIILDFGKLLVRQYVINNSIDERQKPLHRVTLK